MLIMTMHSRNTDLKLKYNRWRSQGGDDGGRNMGATQSSANTKTHCGTNGGKIQGGGRSLAD